uniref:Transposase n=1 Tax=Escherichia coli TaxID=562 RepID=A0A3G4RTN7_ECOLX|nr:transposase [Escherichia coli]
MTRSGGDFQPRPLKRLFTANQCWTSFLDAGGLRDIEVEAVTKMRGDPPWPAARGYWV